MVATLIGSLVFSELMNAKVPLGQILTMIFSVSSVALLIPAVVHSYSMRLFSFLVFEVCYPQSFYAFPQLHLKCVMTLDRFAAGFFGPQWARCEGELNFRCAITKHNAHRPKSNCSQSLNPPFVTFLSPSSCYRLRLSTLTYRRVVPDSVRTTVMNLFRVPLNFFVCVTLLYVKHSTIHWSSIPSCMTLA